MSQFAPRAGTFRGWDRFDYLMLLAGVALTVYGLLLIHSGSLRDQSGSALSFGSPAARQLVFGVIGVAFMIGIAKLDYHYLTHFAWALYGFSILSLIAVLAFGTTEGGSTRWFTLGPIQVQPSEFAKLATILVLARYFSEHGGDARGVRALVVSFLFVVPCALLVFIQPDLGTAIVFGCIWLGVIVIAGVRARHLLVLAGAGLAILPFAWTFAVADYQVERIDVLVDPEADPLDAGYNVIQSQLAIGSGGWFGNGFTEGKQTQDGFLRVPTRDFIFSVLGEEFGFVGALVLFALYVLLLWRGIRAAQIAGDVSGQLIAVGIVVLLLMQTFINVAVNVSLFPVTGIPLPFVSQGGSSLVSVFISLGVLQSIVMRHRAYRQT